MPHPVTDTAVDRKALVARRRSRFHAPVVALIVLAAACSGNSTTNDALDGAVDGIGAGEQGADGAVRGEPLSVSVSVDENPDNALSAIIRFDIDEPVRAGLTATADDHEVVLAATELGDEPELALVGLRPDTDYEISVEVHDAGGAALEPAAPVRFTSGSLPEDFPTIDVEVDPDRAADGMTLLSLKPWRPPSDGRAVPTTEEEGPLGYLAVVDHDGYVVWYHATERGVLDARQLDDGGFMFTYDETVVHEIDVRGRLVRELVGRVTGESISSAGDAPSAHVVTAMDTDSAHHDAGRLPNGNVLMLSTELVAVEGPPRCGEDAAEVTYQVVADVVAEVEPDTGALAGEWRLIDVYNPFDRPGEQLCVEGSPFAPPNYFYDVDDARDWTHGNSVELDEDRNALIVSLRHLNAVLAIRYQDDADGPAGELLWELGPNGTLPLDGEPSYHQHAAKVLAGGRILVYDNGNTRPGAALGGDGAAPYSRAVIYAVDDTSPDRSTWSARQEWEHVLEAGGRPVFTAFLGDTDELPNGNILITHGAISDEGGNLSARVVEVARAEVGGDVVFDLRVHDDVNGWTVYRSERIESLTPGA